MNREKGFTLIELLIVVATIAIISAITIPSLMRADRNISSLQEFGCKLGDNAPACVSSLARRIAEAESADLAAWNELQEALNTPTTLTPLETGAWAVLQRNIAILQARQLRTHRESARIRKLADHYFAEAKSPK